MAKTLLSRTQRRTELRLQLRDGDTNTLWSDAALNSALNEALTYVQVRYPTIKRTKIAATGTRAYLLPTDCMGVRRVWVQDGSTGTGANPPEEIAAWAMVKGYGVDYVTPLTNAWEATLVLDAQYNSPSQLLVAYAPIPPQWGDASTPANDSATIELAPDEGTDAFAELLFYAAARAAAYRWAMAQLPGAGSEDYGREYAAALAERDKLTLMVSGPRETFRLTTGIFG